MLENQTEIPSCLVPQCKTESKTRGLCSTHYMYAHRLVTRGKTSWAELKTQGKCLGSHSSPNPTKDWFLKGMGEVDIQEVVPEDLNTEYEEVDENQQLLEFNAEAET
jgi:hypothetical protein